MINEEFHDLPESIQLTLGHSFKDSCNHLRGHLKVVAEHVVALKRHKAVTGYDRAYCSPESNKGEMTASIMLAYRHLEDAAMRLGKAIEAWDGGKSCYDTAKTTVPCCDPFAEQPPVFDGPACNPIPKESVVDTLRNEMLAIENRARKMGLMLVHRESRDCTPIVFMLRRSGEYQNLAVAHGREQLPLLNDFLDRYEDAERARFIADKQAAAPAPFVQPPPVFVGVAQMKENVDAEINHRKTASQVLADRAEAETALAKAHAELAEAARIAREQAAERATAQDKKNFLCWADAISQSLGWGFSYCAEDNHYALTPPAPRPIIHLYSRVAVQNCLEAASREYDERPRTISATIRRPFPHGTGQTIQDSPAHTYKPFTDKTR